MIKVICHNCNKAVEPDSESCCCKGHRYHKECRCLICGKLPYEQEVIATLRRALEKAADAQDGCPTPLSERNCPPNVTCQECWIRYYVDEEKE